VMVPPLIIIGTNVGTNPPSASPAPKLETTNSQPPVAPANPTNEVSVAQTNLVAETNIVSVPIKTSTVQTNAVASSTENSGVSGGGALKIGVALLIGAAALVILMIRRARKSGGSLITRSMDDKK
ncbi:MAG: hypothetical protein ACREDS_16540, partial [Limisphaerales bacterium]